MVGPHAARQAVRGGPAAAPAGRRRAAAGRSSPPTTADGRGDRRIRPPAGPRRRPRGRCRNEADRQRGRVAPTTSRWGRVRTSTAALDRGVHRHLVALRDLPACPLAAAGTDHPGGAAGFIPDRPTPGCRAPRCNRAPPRRRRRPPRPRRRRRPPRPGIADPADLTHSRRHRPRPPRPPRRRPDCCRRRRAEPVPATVVYLGQGSDVDARGSRCGPLGLATWRAVITLDHVSKAVQVGGATSPDNVSVKIDKGEFVFLIGPSGSGESTFMRLLLAEDTPTSGDIRVSKFHVNNSPATSPSFWQVIGCVSRTSGCCSRRRSSRTWRSPSR